MPSFAVAGASSPVGLSADQGRVVAGQVGIVDVPTQVQQNVGLKGSDETAPEKKFSLGNLLPAAISALGFKKPEITRTEPDRWRLDIAGIRFPAFLVGLFNNLRPVWGTTDVIENDTLLRDTAVKGRGLTGFYDGWQGIVTPAEDIGQRMIPDALQTFNQFAGGLLRDVSSETGITKILDWKKGLEQRSVKQPNMFEQRSVYNENMNVWAANWEEYITKGWNRNLKGQGWNVFSGGLPVRIGTSVPVRVQRGVV